MNPPQVYMYSPNASLIRILNSYIPVKMLKIQQWFSIALRSQTNILNTAFVAPYGSALPTPQSLPHFSLSHDPATLSFSLPSVLPTACSHFSHTTFAHAVALRRMPSLHHKAFWITWSHQSSLSQLFFSSVKSFLSLQDTLSSILPFISLIWVCLNILHIKGVISNLIFVYPMSKSIGQAAVMFTSYLCQCPTMYLLGISWLREQVALLRQTCKLCLVFTEIESMDYVSRLCI